MNLYKNLQVASFALFTLVASVTLSQAATAKDTIRVNCGGAAFTDSAGHSWVADSGFSGGQTYNANSAIANTPDDVLYQYERWDSQDFSYNFNVTPGTYKVNLLEASLYSGACQANGRIFDVTINGTKVLTDYDMFTEVGCLYAQTKTFMVSTSNNGKITIDFNIGAAGNPKIDAIEILYQNSTTGIRGQTKASAGDSKLSIAGSKGGFSVQTQAEGAYTLELSNLQGKRLDQKHGFGSGTQSFSNLKPGLYFLTSHVGHQAITRTISVIR